MSAPYGLPPTLAAQNFFANRTKGNLIQSRSIHRYTATTKKIKKKTFILLAFKNGQICPVLRFSMIVNSQYHKTAKIDFRAISDAVRGI